MVVSRYARFMVQGSSPAEITVRPAASRDAEGITRIYMESAEYHAQLEPRRFYIPDAQGITARYREGQQHPPEAGEDAVTLVAESAGNIVGFVDVRLSRSPDPMHREMLYCHIVEIAVSSSHQSRGIGAQLLRAAEEWGRVHGAQLASLEYLIANKRAESLYQRLGYWPAQITAVKRI